MNVVHVVPQVDRVASGLSHSAPNLCGALVGLGNRVGLLCTAARNGLGPTNVSVIPHWPALEGFSISPRLVRELARLREEVDIIHNHSLWTFFSIAPGLLGPGSQAKLVCSPRGTLSPWALSISRKKKQALWPLQPLTLSRASLLHATSAEEMEQIRACGFRAPVAVISSGVDTPSFEGSAKKGERRTLRFLSRIHVTKGIDRLLHAWKSLQQKHPDWDLVIAGKDATSYLSVCNELVRDLELERVHFPGPLYGEEKSAAYRCADLFVLPTHSENFGLVVAEALAHGCPVVVSKGAPWSGVEQTDSGWWTDNSVHALAASLNEAMSCSRDVLIKKGANGREWMQRDFNWGHAAEKMQWARQDWQPPTLDGVHLRLVPDASSVEFAVAQAPPESVHICQGIRGNGLVSVEQGALKRRGLRHWVVMEMVEDGGSCGIVKRLLYRALFLRWGDRLEGVLACGWRTADWVVARGMPSEKVFPFAYFLPDAPSATQAAPESDAPFRFLFVGQFIERKRLDLLIDTLGDLATDSHINFHLQVVGSGPLEGGLRSHARRELGLCLEWTGGLQMASVLQTMSRADCLVLPSRHDGWGAVVSEALMAGTPVVCSDACGAAGVVAASGTGGVFPTGRGRALYDLLHAALRRGKIVPAQRQKVSAWARALGADAGAAYLSGIMILQRWRGQSTGRTLGSGSAKETRMKFPLYLRRYRISKLVADAAARRGASHG